MRISDWSSDVCSSDLDDRGRSHPPRRRRRTRAGPVARQRAAGQPARVRRGLRLQGRQRDAGQAGATGVDLAVAIVAACPDTKQARISAPVSVSCTASHRYIRTSRSCALALVLAFALTVALRGPSVAPEAADTTRGRSHMD